MSLTERADNGAHGLLWSLHSSFRQLLGDLEQAQSVDSPCCIPRRQISPAVPDTNDVNDGGLLASQGLSARGELLFGANSPSRTKTPYLRPAEAAD